MAKKITGKIEKAEKARATAVAALADAEELDRRAPAGAGKKLAAATTEVKKLATISVKRLSRHPKRTRRKLEQATTTLEERIASARKKLDTSDAAAGAPQAPDDASDAPPAVDAATLAQAQAHTLPAPDLSGLTMYELRQRAKSEGRSGFSRLSKAQLVELLTP